MKKLKLTAIKFHEGEVLTRTQLKKVMGGYGSSTGNPQSDAYLRCHPTCTAEANAAGQSGLPGGGPPAGVKEMVYASCMSQCLMDASDV